MNAAELRYIAAASLVAFLDLGDQLPAGEDSNASALAVAAREPSSSTCGADSGPGRVWLTDARTTIDVVTTDSRYSDRSRYQIKANIVTGGPLQLDKELALAFERGDVQGAAELVYASHERLIRDGLEADLVRWIMQLPADVLLNRPDMSLVLGRAAGLVGDTTTATVVLRSIQAYLATADEPARAAMQIGLAHLEATVAILRGDLGGICEYFAILDDSLNSSGAHQNVDACARGPIRSSIALGHLFRGELEEAITIADEVIATSEAIAPTRTAVLAMGVRALALAWSGDRLRSRQVIREGLKLADRFRGRSLGLLTLHTAACWVADEGDLNTSLESANEYGNVVAHPTARLLVCLGSAELFWRHGMVARASEWLARSDEAMALMVDPAFLGTMRDRLGAVIDECPAVELTPQEVQCLAAIARGLTRSEAADELHYSLNTVKTHLRHAYAKLGARDRDAAVAKAQLLGLLTAGVE